MIHIGLFEGIGGFSLAAHWAGWQTYATCEINPIPQRVLKYHFPKAYHHGDIKTLNYDLLNNELIQRFGTEWRKQPVIITGGFPCQPFSLAGKRTGKDDNRFLWPEFKRIIIETQPDVIVAENVAGLFTILEPESLTEVEKQEIQLFSEDETYEVNTTIERVQRRVIASIIEEIRAAGYVFPTLEDGTPIILCVPACAVNAPHRRDRVWFVAHRNGLRRTQEYELQQSEIHKQYGTGRTTTNPNSNGYELWGFGKDRQEKGESIEISKERKWIRSNDRGIGEQGDVTDAENLGQQFSGRTWKRRAGFENSNKQNASDTDSSKRCEGRLHKTRHIQTERHISTCSTWNGGGTWQNFPTQSPVCSRNDGIPAGLDGITVHGKRGIRKLTQYQTWGKLRNESIKAYGNAIVPQVAYEIFNAINQYQLCTTTQSHYQDKS